MDPSGQYVYVVSGNSNSVLSFPIGTGGALGTYSGTPAQPGPFAIAVTPTGNFAYATSTGDDSVQVFSISAGTLTSGNEYSTGQTPHAVAISPNGLYLYVANYTDGSVSQFTINGDGSVTAMSPSAVPSGADKGSQPTSIAFDPSGTYLYVTNNGDDSVTQFSYLGTNGMLNNLGDASTGTNTGPSAVATGP